jgi:hypothetical protein
VGELATMGLLRDACGLTLTQTARVLDRTPATVLGGRREYSRRILNEEDFATKVAVALASAVRASAPVPSGNCE